MQWWEYIQQFFNENEWLKIVLNTYFIFILVLLIVYLIAHSRRAFYLVIVIGVICI